MMQALSTRGLAAAVRIGRSGSFSVPVATAVRTVVAALPQHALGDAGYLPNNSGQQRQQHRGLAVERMVHGMKIPDGVTVSDPVLRVLSIENGDTPQKKQMLKRLEVEKWQRHVSDTGSPECQIAALTVRIDSLHKHVTSNHRMDFSCKRGYVKLLARRRKMMAYLKRKDFEIYRKVARETGLR